MTPERYQRILAVLNHRQPDLTVLVDGVHKPHNLSAIQRTCDAVGCLQVHAVASERPFKVRRGIARSSEKWVEAVSHKSIDSAIDHLQGRGFRIVAAHFSDRTIDYRDEDYTQPIAVLMGTEKYGVSDQALERVDGEIIVPMQGMVASLNVSVAAAIILYEAQRQRQNAGLYAAPRLSDADIRERLFRWGYPRLVPRYEALGLPFPRLDDQGEILDPIPEKLKRKLPVK